MSSNKKQNYIVCIAEYQTLKVIPGVWITYSTGLFKINFGHDYFISGPIFKIFAACFTAGLRKDDMVRFSFSVSEK